MPILKNIKTVANLSNNKDVFVCILCFHARAGYLQHYENLLKELNAQQESDPIPLEQYEVERVALADRNLNLSCESWFWSLEDTIKNYGIILPFICTYWAGICMYMFSTSFKLYIYVYIHMCI